MSRLTARSAHADGGEELPTLAGFGAFWGAGEPAHPVEAAAATAENIQRVESGERTSGVSRIGMRRPEGVRWSTFVQSLVLYSPRSQRGFSSCGGPSAYLYILYA